MWAYLYDAGRLVIAAALLVAGASKLAGPRRFASSLGEVFGLARVTRNGLARTVAAAELIAAFMLASAWSVTLGLALTALVGAGIVVFVLIAMSRGSTAPCGCFGESGSRPIGVRNLLAGVGLLAGAIILPLLPVAGATPLPPLTALTSVIALLAVMVRDRARLLAPFRHYFQPAPAVAIPPHRRTD